MDWTAITDSQAAQIAIYLTGLFACWGSGLKVGVVIQKIRSLGKFM